MPFPGLQLRERLVEEMISVEEALRIIAQTAPLEGTEELNVYDCVGRIAAEDLVSPID